MIFVICGIGGILVSAYITKTLHDHAVTGRKTRDDKPFGGAVPGWVSLLCLASFGIAIYGLYKLIF